MYYAQPGVAALDNSSKEEYMQVRLRSVVAAMASSIAVSILLPSGPASAEEMRATWYDCPLAANCVANRHYPKGTVLLLFNPRTRKSTHAVVLDYGPETWTGRALDVSRQIAQRLDMIQAGVVTLEVQILYRPPTKTTKTAHRGSN